MTKTISITLLIIFLYSTLSAFEIPKNESIDYWVRKFESKSLHNFFQNSLNKSTLYRPRIISVFKERGIPIELSWLPLIESGFDCSSESTAEAAGCWQFMLETGKEYGLNIGVWEDERYDFNKSTLSAAKYLKILYDNFDDWELALAAYNWGPTRLKRRIKKNKTRDFWKLSLPRETANYIPKFYASLVIVNDLQKYGFKTPKNNHITVVLKKGFHDLRRISKLLRVDYKDFRRLNPGYKVGYTPNKEITLYLEKGWNHQILESFGLIKGQF